MYTFCIVLDYSSCTAQRLQTEISSEDRGYKRISLTQAGVVLTPRNAIPLKVEAIPNPIATDSKSLDQTPQPVISVQQPVEVEAQYDDVILLRVPKTSSPSSPSGSSFDLIEDILDTPVDFVLDDTVPVDIKVLRGFTCPEDGKIVTLLRIAIDLPETQEDVLGLAGQDAQYTVDAIQNVSVHFFSDQIRVEP